MRFDWKCKSADIPGPPPHKEAEVKKIVEIVENETKPDVEENVVKANQTSKPPKKEGKKSAGSSMMDIGVWNPDAVKNSEENGDVFFKGPFSNVFKIVT